jgi:hypothetical protein
MTGLVDGFHDALAEPVAPCKNQVARWRRPDRRRRRYCALNEGLHDVVRSPAWHGKVCGVEVRIAVQAEGVQCPDPGIGFGHHRVSGYFDQSAGVFRVETTRPAATGMSGGLETTFHQVIYV